MRQATRFSLANPFATHKLGPIEARYTYRTHGGATEWTLLPAGMEAPRMEEWRGEVASHPFMEGKQGGMTTFGNALSDNLVQLAVRGLEGPTMHGEGLTQRNGESTTKLELKEQTIDQEGGTTRIETIQEVPGEYAVIHRVEHRDGDPCCVVETEFRNTSDRPLTLDMLSSFSLNQLSPFALDDAPNRLKLHRFRSFWCLEGRPEGKFLEELHLERSAWGSFPVVEQFGQVGSSPARKWFPFIALEDTATGVFWGAQILWHGSWQMECYRKDDRVSLSGGLADRLSGHWWKTVQPGESFVSPRAILTSVAGDLDDLCAALTEQQSRMAHPEPESEKSLPIIFNEWCTSWGHPNEENVGALADSLKDSKARYLVIDAGWFEKKVHGDSQIIGDWNVCPEKFPNGLQPVTGTIRNCGKLPGIWFEFEYVSRESEAYRDTENLLHRDGLPFGVRKRRAWDLRKEGALTYLREKVLGRLREDGFKYLKIDYNESLGFGFDGAESPGEALRQHLAAVSDFIREMREAIPDLVVENCASGGHRLEPGLVALTSMSSFSDAHETLEIPIVAANTQRLIPAHKNQIWIVLRPDDDAQRLYYGFAATLLGRMCLSGDIVQLSPQQRAILDEAEAYYEAVAPVIRSGKSRVHQHIGPSWRYPEGWQAVVRSTGTHALVTYHEFAGKKPERRELPLPEGNWAIESVLNPGLRVRAERVRLELDALPAFSGASILLRKAP
ncbi:MAG: glycoside hydrolase family 36 protein [Puniceicoccaceae bacterium]